MHPAAKVAAAPFIGLAIVGGIVLVGVTCLVFVVLEFILVLAACTVTAGLLGNPFEILDIHLGRDYLSCWRNIFGPVFIDLDDTRKHI